MPRVAQGERTSELLRQEFGLARLQTGVRGELALQPFDDPSSTCAVQSRRLFPAGGESPACPGLAGSTGAAWRYKTGIKPEQLHSRNFTDTPSIKQTSAPLAGEVTRPAMTATPRW